jgi:hypothetical protein
MWWPWVQTPVPPKKKKKPKKKKTPSQGPTHLNPHFLSWNYEVGRGMRKNKCVADFVEKRQIPRQGIAGDKWRHALSSLPSNPSSVGFWVWKSCHCLMEIKSEFSRRSQDADSSSHLRPPSSLASVSPWEEALVDLTAQWKFWNHPEISKCLLPWSNSEQLLDLPKLWKCFFPRKNRDLS